VHKLNLNRIYYATMADAQAEEFKVDVIGGAVERIGLGTVVERYPVNLYSPEAVKAVAGCDVVFGCVDTSEGRFLLNLIANFYLLPYVDLGVTVEAESDGEIAQVCGYLHYLQPGRSSLLSRGSITLEDVRAEGLKRQNPAYYEQQRKAGYIKGRRKPPCRDQHQHAICGTGCERTDRAHSPVSREPKRTVRKNWSQSERTRLLSRTGTERCLPLHEQAGWQG
jgi:hypothetical protein